MACPFDVDTMDLLHAKTPETMRTKMQRQQEGVSAAAVGGSAKKQSKLCRPFLNIESDNEFKQSSPHAAACGLVTAQQIGAGDGKQLCGDVCDGEEGSGFVDGEGDVTGEERAPQNEPPKGASVGRGESSRNDRIVRPSALCACKSGKLFSECHAPLLKSRLPKSTAPTTPPASIGAMVASEVSGVDSGSVCAGGVARPNTNICPNKMGSPTMILPNTKTPQTMRTKKRRKQEIGRAHV